MAPGRSRRRIKNLFLSKRSAERSQQPRSPLLYDNITAVTSRYLRRWCSSSCALQTLTLPVSTRPKGLSPRGRSELAVTSCLSLLWNLICCRIWGGRGGRQIPGRGNFARTGSLQGPIPKAITLLNSWKVSLHILKLPLKFQTERSEKEVRVNTGNKKVGGEPSLFVWNLYPWWSESTHRANIDTQTRPQSWQHISKGKR